MDGNMDEFFFDLLFPNSGAKALIEGRWEWLWSENLEVYDAKSDTLWSSLQLQTYMVHHCVVIATVVLFGLAGGLMATRARKKQEMTLIMSKPRTNLSANQKVNDITDTPKGQFTKNIKKYLSKKPRQAETSTSRLGSKVSNETRCLLEWDGDFKNRSCSKRVSRNYLCEDVSQTNAVAVSKFTNKESTKDMNVDEKQLDRTKTKSTIRIDEFGDVTCLAANTVDKNERQSGDQLNQKQKFKNPNLMLSLHSPPIQDTVDEPDSSESSSKEVSGYPESNKEIEKQQPEEVLNKNEPDSSEKSSLKKSSLQKSSVPHPGSALPATWTKEVKEHICMSEIIDKTESEVSEETLSSGRLDSFISKDCNDQNVDQGGDWVNLNKIETPNRKHAQYMKSTAGLKCNFEEDIYNPKYFAPAVGNAKAQCETKPGEEGDIKRSSSAKNQEQIFQMKSELLKHKDHKNKPKKEIRLSSNLSQKFQARCEKKPPRFVVNHQVEDAKHNLPKQQIKDVTIHGNNSLTFQCRNYFNGLKASKPNDHQAVPRVIHNGKRDKMKFLKRSELKHFYKELLGSDELDNRPSEKNEFIIDKSNYPINKLKPTKIHEKHREFHFQGVNGEQNEANLQMDEVLNTTHVYKSKHGASPKNKTNSTTSNSYRTSETLSPGSSRRYSPFTTHQADKSTFRLNIGQCDDKKILEKRHLKASKINDLFLEKRIREWNSFNDSFDASKKLTNSPHQLKAQTAQIKLVTKPDMVKRNSHQTSKTQLSSTQKNGLVSELGMTDVQKKEFVPLQYSYIKLVSSSPTQIISSEQRPRKKVSIAVHRSQNPDKGDARKDLSRISRFIEKPKKIACANMNKVETLIKQIGNRVSERKHKLTEIKSSHDAVPTKNPTIGGLDQEPKAKIKRCNEYVLPNDENQGNGEDLECLLNERDNDNLSQIPINTEVLDISPVESPDQHSYIVEHPTMATSPHVGEKQLTTEDNQCLILESNDKQRRALKMKSPFKIAKGKKKYQASNKVQGNANECDMRADITCFGEGHGKSNEGVGVQLPIKNDNRTSQRIPSILKTQLEVLSQANRGNQIKMSNGPSMSKELKDVSSGDKVKFSNHEEKINRQPEPKFPTCKKAISPKRTPALLMNTDQVDNNLKSDGIKKFMKSKTKFQTENDNQVKTPSTYKTLHKNRSKMTPLLPPKSTREFEKPVTPKGRNGQIRPSVKIQPNKLPQTSQEKMGSKKVESCQVARRILKGRRMRVVKGGNAARTPSAQTLSTSREIDLNSRYSDIMPTDTLSYIGPGGSQQKETLDELLVLNRISYSSATSYDSSKKIDQFTVDEENETPFTNSPAKQLTKKKNDRGSILSNLAYIEDLNSEEIEKLSLPQQVPDLITTSSGDSAGANCLSQPVKKDCQLKERSFSLKHRDESKEVRNGEAGETHGENKTSKNKTMHDNNIAQVKNEFKNLFFVESLAAPLNTDNENTKLNNAESPKINLRENESVYPENTLKRILKKQLADNKLNLSDSKLCKKISSQKLLKTNSMLIGSKSCGQNFTLSAHNQELDNSDFQTPNFQNIFSNKDNLEKWSKLNNISGYRSDSRVSKNITSNHGTVEKETGYVYQQPSLSTITMEADKSLSLCNNVEKSSALNKTLESSKEQNDYKISSGRNVQVPSQSRENVSWDVSQNKLKLKNRRSNQLNDEYQITSTLKNASSWIETESIEDGMKTCFGNNERNSSSSDLAITWLGEKTTDAPHREKPTGGKKRSNHHIGNEGSRHCNLALSISSKTLLKPKSFGESCSTGTSRTQFSSETSGDNQMNVFLNMQRIKLPQLKDVPDKPDCKVSRLTSPPRQSRYVKSALSYSKKKRTSDGSSAVKCPETYCIEQNSEAEANLITSHQSINHGSNPTIICDGTQANIQLAEATKNNNKLPISFTSLHYTTQIDAVENDSSNSMRQPPFYNYALANIDGISNCDNTSDDVSTSELCTTWASERMGAVSTQTEIVDSSFTSTQQTRVKSFILDWYRPNPRTRPTMMTPTTGSEEIFESDSEEINVHESVIHSTRNSALDSRYRRQRHPTKNDPINISQASQVNHNPSRRLYSPPNHCGIDDTSSHSRYSAYHTQLNKTANQRSLMSGDSNRTRVGGFIDASFKPNAEFCHCHSRYIFQPRDSVTCDDSDLAANISDTERFSTVCNPSYSATQNQHSNTIHIHEDILNNSGPKSSLVYSSPQSKSKASSRCTGSRDVVAVEEINRISSSEALNAPASHTLVNSMSSELFPCRVCAESRPFNETMSIESENSSFCTCQTPYFAMYNSNDMSQKDIN